MTDDEEATKLAGCASCWPESPDEAWMARASLSQKAELIDESHFHVMILACIKCGQRFLSVFTETIDWTDGDDPQHWALMPVTDEESRELIEPKAPLEEAHLSALGQRRRSLRHDHPKGAASRSYWSRGFTVRYHDRAVIPAG
ncbi:MAG: hypothetical protein KJZ83_06435 [Burkholderiaceae bacterium]|nr:hypothetical protein [Burkholderiaceae bacterium]